MVQREDEGLYQLLSQSFNQSELGPKNSASGTPQRSLSFSDWASSQSRQWRLTYASFFYQLLSTQLTQLVISHLGGARKDEGWANLSKRKPMTHEKVGNIGLKFTAI